MSDKPRKPRKPPRKSITLFFLRGLGALLPLVLTIFVFVTLVNFVRNYVTTPINDTIYWSLESNGLGWKVLDRLAIDPYDPRFLDRAEIQAEPTGLSTGLEKYGAYSTEFQTELSAHRRDHEGFFRDLEELYIDPEKLRDEVTNMVHPLVGLLLSMLLVLWLGWIVTGFLGRRLLQRFDQALLAIPGFRAVYPYMKQLVEFFIKEENEKSIEFDAVVGVPYPNPEIFSIGFVTSQSLKSLTDHVGEDLVSIFIPSSPMPMTGYTIHVKRYKIIKLNLTVDEALRITVSGGVLVPPQEFVGKGLGEMDPAAGDDAAPSAPALPETRTTANAKHTASTDDDSPDSLDPK